MAANPPNDKAVQTRPSAPLRAAQFLLLLNAITLALLFAQRRRFGVKG